MTQSRDLLLRIAKLAEMSEILTAMKNLSLIENHKLAQIVPLQRDCLETMNRVAEEFLRSFPESAKIKQPLVSVTVLLGSERGFCGDFNAPFIATHVLPVEGHLVVIGNKLANKLPDDVSATIMAGANVTEETPDVVERILDYCLATTSLSNLALTIYYRDSALGQVQKQCLLPLENAISVHTGSNHATPLLNLPAEAFFAELSSHYLLTTLYNVVYQALFAEQQRRIQHLEGALNHLNRQITKLHRKSQIYRQEEITEEIEVILLNAQNS